MPFMKGHEWCSHEWQDVAKGALVRTADGRHWRVTDRWDQRRVLLTPTTEYGQRTGPPVPVPLLDGTKTVDVSTGIPIKPRPAPLVGPHEFQLGNRGECWFGDCRAPMDDPIHTPPPWAPDTNGTDPADPMTPLPPIGTKAVHDSMPKFLPAARATAAEQLQGDARDDEGRAVAALAAGGLEPELVSVEEGGEIKVPRELDDMALRSHLFLMHGRFYDAQDVERSDLERDHRASHDAGDPGHIHVSRGEL